MKQGSLKTHLVPFLQSFITRSASAFGDCPSDIVEWTFSLAGLAMQTVGRIGRLYLIVHRLVYPRRTECNAGTAELRSAFFRTDIAV